ncbi:hypothetical protein VTN49DRAFT_1928 [Thermomyces lanuginosus]|uniref:uncharacterized protein n=1 Tax=Thermomyces lanuginosus TaxID=5541 RepID=UPI003743AB81
MAASSTESEGQFASIFETFRSELDEHYDRREKIVKASRDITALSKKIIFSLQRTRDVNAPIPPRIVKENEPRFQQIRELFESILPDITGLNAWRYQWQISPGIQEFVEAVSFQHYLEHQTLISRDEVAAKLPEGVLLTEEDYLMGILDMTGELMRFAVTTLSTATAAADSASKGGTSSEEGGGTASKVLTLPPKKAGIVVDLRELRSLLELLTVPRRHGHFVMRDLGNKLEVMQTSVHKVERAAYGIMVRGSERPSGWTPDLSSNMVDVEGY